MPEMSGRRTGKVVLALEKEEGSSTGIKRGSWRHGAAASFLSALDRPRAKKCEQLAPEIGETRVPCVQEEEARRSWTKRKDAAKQVFLLVCGKKAWTSSRKRGTRP